MTAYVKLTLVEKIWSSVEIYLNLRPDNSSTGVQIPLFKPGVRERVSRGRGLHSHVFWLVRLTPNSLLNSFNFLEV